MSKIKASTLFLYGLYCSIGYSILIQFIRAWWMYLVLPLFQLLGGLSIIGALGFWIADRIRGKHTYIKY